MTVLKPSMQYAMMFIPCASRTIPVPMMTTSAKVFAPVKATCIFVAHFTLAQLTNTMIPEACDSLTLFIKLDMIQTVRCSTILHINSY